MKIFFNDEFDFLESWYELIILVVVIHYLGKNRLVDLLALLIICALGFYLILRKAIYINWKKKRRNERRNIKADYTRCNIR